MEKSLSYYDKSLRPFSTRRVSDSLSYDTENGDVSPNPYTHTRMTLHRQSSLARRRWAASMHAAYLIRLFESFLHNPFYSLVLSLRMFGLMVNIDSKNTRTYSSREQKIRALIIKCLRYVLTGFMVIYILYYSIRTTLTITKGGIWTNLKVLINAWITFWTVCLFLFRNDRVGSLMIQIQSVNAFVKDISPILKRNVMIAIGILWIYLVISVVTFFLDFSYHKVLEKAITEFFRKAKRKKSTEDIFMVNYGDWQVSKTGAAFVVYIDTILSVYFVRGTLVVIIFTYILLNHSIETLYKDLKDYSVAQNKQSKELTIKGLRELKNRHHLLAHFTQEVDLVFSFIVFLWYILVLISFCIRVNTVIDGEYSSANIEGWVSSIWSIGITLLIYIGVTMSAALLAEQAVLSALSIEKLCMKPVSLTCYKFFAIKKFLILMIALCVVAYYFFVVHFDLIRANIQLKIVNTNQ